MTADEEKRIRGGRLYGTPAISICLIEIDTLRQQLDLERGRLIQAGPDRMVEQLRQQLAEAQAELVVAKQNATDYHRDFSRQCEVAFRLEAALRQITTIVADIGWARDIAQQALAGPEASTKEVGS